MIRVGVLTASDRGARGERDEDRSAAVIRELVAGIGGEVQSYVVVPDEREAIAAALRRMADEEGMELVLTTGGTGLGPRDVTPEATMDVAQRLVPGIPEAMRREGAAHTPRAMLTRAVAAERGGCLIVNLPGSPRGVRENLGAVLEALGHAVELLRGAVRDCARPED